MNQALVSIHDVMPETLRETDELLALCRESDVENVALLVVPGKRWSLGEVQRLRRYADSGVELIAHGWIHQCDSIRTIHHKLHSFFLSRNVAEHLSRTRSEVLALMTRAATWFHDNLGFVPQTYIPPAWAMGGVRPADCQRLPFECVESLSGLHFPRSGRFLMTPLLGFEADTAVRKWAISGFNALNRLRASTTTHPIRIAVHPFDHRLKLAASLKATLSDHFQTIRYSEVTEEHTCPNCP